MAFGHGAYNSHRKQQKKKDMDSDEHHGMQASFAQETHTLLSLRLNISLAFLHCTCVHCAWWEARSTPVYKLPQNSKVSVKGRHATLCSSLSVS